MKFIPILFSIPMVQAINEDRKTMTRRTIKFPKGWVAEDNAWDWAALHEYYPKWGCPYGQIGDILWVRETFREMQHGFDYKSDYPDRVNYKWKPNIFMPKSACRTFLEITNIRVERLQDISDEDAKAEGAKDHLKVDEMKMLTGLDNWIIPAPFSGYQFGFLSIWCKINGCESWLANPWVWVIEFKKIEKPENFN